MVKFFQRIKDPEEDPIVKVSGKVIPLLPLRDLVIFPYMVVPLFVGREKSISALDAAMEGDKMILMATQKNAKVNNPRESDIYKVGTISHIIQLLKLPDGTVKVLVEGKKRARILQFISHPDHFLVEAEEIEENIEESVELAALIRGVMSAFRTYSKLNKKVPQEVVNSISSIDDPSRLSDALVVHLSMKLEERQGLLSNPDPVKRLERIYALIQGK